MGVVFEGITYEVKLNITWTQYRHMLGITRLFEQQPDLLRNYIHRNPKLCRWFESKIRENLTQLVLMEHKDALVFEYKLMTPREMVTATLCGEKFTRLIKMKEAYEGVSQFLEFLHTCGVHDTGFRTRSV